MKNDSTEVTSAPALVEAAVAHLRETCYLYGHTIDADSIVHAQHHFATQGFADLAAVVDYFHHHWLDESRSPETRVAAPSRVTNE